MKTLFIYYSNTGNGDLVAEHLSNKGLDIRKVERKKKMPKTFFFNVMTGGFLASVGHKDKLVDFDNNINDYEHIIIGSPIWNDRFSSPINTVLSKLDLTNKKIAFVLYSGSGEGKHAKAKIEKNYPNALVVMVKEPKKYNDELSKLDELIKE